MAIHTHTPIIRELSDERGWQDTLYYNSNSNIRSKTQIKSTTKSLNPYVEDDTPPFGPIGISYFGTPRTSPVVRMNTSIVDQPQSWTSDLKDDLQHNPVGCCD